MEPKELQAMISSELGSSEVTPRNLLCAMRRLSERCMELTASWPVSTGHSVACDDVKPYTPHRQLVHSSTVRRSGDLPAIKLAQEACCLRVGFRVNTIGAPPRMVPPCAHGAGSGGTAGMQGQHTSGRSGPHSGGIPVGRLPG